MRVLVVGGGGREHGLVWKVTQSPHVTQVFAAPGNAGIAELAECVNISASEVRLLAEFAVKKAIDLTVVGPELPLTLGIVDEFEGRGLRIFGATRQAASLEGSKVFAKRLMKKYRIPTGFFQTFYRVEDAKRYIQDVGAPVVVKADGLAAGKGVVVSETVDEACAAIDRLMRKREFGDAGRVVVLEERLAGDEASFHVVCDGTGSVALAPAQDHKRVGDGDQGPNTGGMGAYAPAPVVDSAVLESVTREIVRPTLDGMAAEGAPFRGVLFVGLMIDRGRPQVLEYNVRFGDPETTVLVPTYAGDWFELLHGAAGGKVPQVPAQAAPVAALSVVMAAAGYPGKPRAGDRIEGLDRPLPPRAFVLHAGTALSADGAVVTSGGRVLTVGASGATLEDAARVAYEVVDGIHWPGEHHRRDIGRRARGGR